jgi:hypothetical protein
MQSKLLKASAWITKKWLSGVMRDAHWANDGTALAEFGAFQANLAEVIVLDHGADFLISRWGAEIGMLCGGDQRGRLLSGLPQPSRSQLRRICVRAMTSRAPIADSAIWAFRGGIWECVMLALPTAGRENGVSNLLVALLFAPHPMFEFHPDDERALSTSAGNLPTLSREH